MSCFKSLTIMAWLTTAFAAGRLAAEDLGTVGPTYAIAEENALDAMLRRLKALERSGALRQMQREAVSRAVASIKSPPPVAGIATVRVASKRLLDPTVHYPRAVANELGQVVVPAGARINPLLVTPLSRKLVFFDGRDRAQSEAVRGLLAQHGTRIKPILVAGSWYDTAKAWKTRVYYDQHGSLSQRFGIVAVPAVVSQAGDRLLIEEIPSGELR